MDNEKIETSEIIPENIQGLSPSQGSSLAPIKEIPSVPKKPRARRKPKKVAEPAAVVAPVVAPVALAPEAPASDAKVGIIIGAVVFLMAGLIVGGSIYAYLKVKKAYITPMASQLQNLSNLPSSEMTVIPGASSELNNAGGTVPASPEEQIFGQTEPAGGETGDTAEEGQQASSETTSTAKTTNETEEDVKDAEEDTEEDAEEDAEEDMTDDSATSPEPVDPYDFDSKISEMDSKMRNLSYENFDSALINDSEVGL
jgi:hypothetical protein